MGLDRRLEFALGFFVISLGGVNHGKVVVRLGQPGIVHRESLKHLDRLLPLVFLGEDQAFQKAPLRILRVLREPCIDLFHGLGIPPFLEQLAGLLKRIGESCVTECR
jgi:hypothetical protein